MVIRQQINLLLQQDFPTGSQFAGGGQGEADSKSKALPTTHPTGPPPPPPQPLFSPAAQPCYAGAGESLSTFISSSAAFALIVIYFPLLLACPGSLERRFFLCGWLFFFFFFGGGGALVCVCVLLSKPFSFGWLRLDLESQRGKARHPSGEERSEEKAAADLLVCSRPGETGH